VEACSDADEAPRRRRVLDEHIGTNPSAHAADGDRDGGPRRWSWPVISSIPGPGELEHAFGAALGRGALLGLDDQPHHGSVFARAQVEPAVGPADPHPVPRVELAAVELARRDREGSARARWAATGARGASPAAQRVVEVGQGPLPARELLEQQRHADEAVAARWIAG